MRPLSTNTLQTTSSAAPPPPSVAPFKTLDDLMAEAGSDGEEVMDEMEQEAQRSRSVTPLASSRPVSAARQRASLGAQKLGLPPVNYTPPTTARLRDHSNLSPRPVSASSSNAGFFAAAPRRLSPGISEGTRASFVASVASAASDLEESVVDVSSASSSGSSSNLSSFHLGGSPISPAVGSGLPRRRSSSAVPLSPIAASGAEDEADVAREKADEEVAATAYTPFSDDAASAQVAEETPEASSPGVQHTNRRREATESDSDASAAARRRRQRQQQQRRSRKHSSDGSYVDDSDRGHGGRRRIPRPVRVNVCERNPAEKREGEEVCSAWLLTYPQPRNRTRGCMRAVRHGEQRRRA